MTRSSTLVAAVLLLATTAVVWAPPGASVDARTTGVEATTVDVDPGETTHRGGSGNDTVDVDPGTVVGSVVDLQGTAIDRSFLLADLEGRLAATDTPAARADVLAAAFERAERRVDRLDARLGELRAARSEGEIGATTYAVRVAPVAAGARSLDPLVERIREAAAGLDPRTLREAGVSRDGIRRLQSRIDRIVAADEGALASDAGDQDLYGRIESLIASYNERADRYDLGVLGSHVSGERIDLHVTGDDGDATVVSFRTTGDARVRDLRAGPHPDATLRVTVDESTARRILNADDPGSVARRAFLAGEIRIDGLGPYNAVKWTIANLAIGVVRAIVGFFQWLFSLLP